MHPELEPEAALDKLWEEVTYVLRLDTDDPVEAWRERMKVIVASADRMTDRRFDSLHLKGAGTDLTIGLMPSSKWLGADFSTADGITHYPNLPTEEVFTTPDPERVDGHVSATMPLELYGSYMNGIRIEFEGGRAVKVDADEGADALRATVAKDDGASRLGEIALVDKEGRIGPLRTVFYETLLDENAASHIALGNAYTFPVEDEADRERVNKSDIHVDFMIGSNELDVDGITRDGDRVPVFAAERGRSSPDRPVRPGWPEEFEAEKARLKPILAPWLAGEIHHVGSRAPGLAAKPVIDILPRCTAWRRAARSSRSRAALLLVGAVPGGAHELVLQALADIGRTTCTSSSRARRRGEELAFRDALRAEPNGAPTRS